MLTTTVADAPANRRGGQTSHLLLAKGQFGSRNLAITWVDCPPGSQQPLQRHDAEEQVYVITRGRGTMLVAGEARLVEEGTMVFVPPGTAHAIRNDGDVPITFVSATAPPFDPAALGPEFAYRDAG